MTITNRSAGSSRGLGPLGRRLLAAFVVVALSSVVVLTVAALVGTALGLSANQSAERQRATSAAAHAAATAYTNAGGWNNADLTQVSAIAAASDARLLITDAAGTVIQAPDSGMMMGPGMVGRSGGRSTTENVVVDGTVVGTVRLGFGTPATGTFQSIAWAWILVAAIVALASAITVSYFVTRRISRPLQRLADVAHDFAAGQREVRAAPEDILAPGELGELARAFDATAEDVVRSETARRQMAADVAHELRTPLAALQAGLEELRDGLVPPDRVRLDALHAQSLRLGRVVADLAELSAAETASLSLRRDSVDLSDVVADAVLAARPSLAAAQLVVTTNIAPSICVTGDAGRLHQAIGNLLANTSRYCRPGDSVVVTLEATSTAAVISVADTGPGIASSDLAHVFDRLWRGQADSNDAGSGIGLAVVREIATAHGGVASVVSTEGEGATFTLRLPVAGAADR